MKAETAAMDPGAVALARRFDPTGSEASTHAYIRLARVESAPTAAPQPAEARRLQARSNALQSARELDCLADAVYYEARGESSDGQAAVAQVVLNRVRRAGYPKSVCGVVYQGAQAHECQFSFACDGAIYRAREEQAWRRAQGVAARALGGFVMAEVGDATHFHVARLGAIWGDNLMRVAQIGTHVFYRLTKHGSFAAHAGHGEDAPDDAVETAAAIPADGGQPTLILASAVSAKPASAPTATASAAAVATAPAAEKPPAAPTAPGSAEPKSQS